MKDKNNLETKCPLRNLGVSEREIYSFNVASGQIEAQPEEENAQMMSTACFENPLFDRNENICQLAPFPNTSYY